MDRRIIIVVFLLIFFQMPSLTVDISLDKSLYQPGETIKIEVTIENKSGVKECIKLLEVTVSDPYSVFWSHSDTYPINTECVDPDDTKVYTFWCDIPVTVSEGKGTVDVTFTTWNDITIQSTEFFEIGVNYPPEVKIIEHPSQVNPAQKYVISFSVFDNFGVEDITLVEVALYAAETGKKVSPRSGYGFTWEKPDIYTVWKGNPGPVQVTASLQPQEIIWTLTFQVSEIAKPGEWILDITAYDVHHKSHSVSEHISITRYMSFHVNGESRGGMASINFGKASPGERLRRVPLTVVVTSNAEVTVSVEAHDLHSPEGGILPVNQFYVKTESSDVQLHNARQVLYSGYGTKGYNQHAHIALVFYGQLPEVLEAGTYSGVWYIVVEVV